MPSTYIDPASRQARSFKDPATFDQIISDARKPYMLHALQVLNRCRQGVGYLFDDEDGHALFIAMHSLGSRKTKWDSVAPWFKLKPKLEREAFEQRIAQFKPTLRNISAAARLTRADRDRYARRVGNKTKRPMQALLQLPYIDGDLEAERRDARNAARRRRRQEKHAAAAATAADRAKERERGRQRRAAKKDAKPHAESLSQTRPWEAEGISRRTWERRRDAKTSTRDRQVDESVSRKAQTIERSMKYRDLAVTPDGPEPKIDRGRTIGPHRWGLPPVIVWACSPHGVPLRGTGRQPSPTPTQTTVAEAKRLGMVEFVFPSRTPTAYGS